jgi:hypothetical protein
MWFLAWTGKQRGRSEKIASRRNSDEGLNAAPKDCVREFIGGCSGGDVRRSCGLGGSTKRSRRR